MNNERIVIAGAGLAALRAAERLRELDFRGELVIVGDEPYRPYHRPALSKQLLTGELRISELGLRSYVDLNAVWRTRTRAVRLDPSRHILELRGEEELRYDGLMIATGVESRHPSGVPWQDPRVHALRTLADAAALRRTLIAENGPVVVIGGGFTACEVAATARELGREVTIVSRSPALLGRVLGPAAGSSIAKLHRSHGVSLAMGVKVVDWIPESSGVGLYLSDRRLLVAGCVVVATGGVPAVQWLRGSGLTLEDGVLCRPSCHVVGVQDVVAAGDVARWPNLRFDNTPRRIEHWINAAEMGRAAAENLLAGAEWAAPFTPTPRFWSEQHGVRLQAAGIPALGTETMRLAGKRGYHGVFGYRKDGRLVGLVGWDSPRALLRWTAALERQLVPVPEHVATEPSRPAATSMQAAADRPIPRTGLSDSDILARLDLEFTADTGRHAIDQGSLRGLQPVQRSRG